MTSRRDFVKGALSALAAGGAVEGARAEQAKDVGKAPPPSGGGVFATQPYAQLIERDAVGLCWLTAQPATGYVTWSQDGWKTSRRVWMQCDGLRDSNSRTHRALVEGFDPTRPLQWRAHSRPIAGFGAYRIRYAGEEETVEGTLKAFEPRPDQLSFAMVNDIHGHVDAYAPLMDCANGPVDFTVFAGDIVSAASSEDAIRKGLLGPLAYVTGRTQAPCWYLRGNHETRGDSSRRFRDYLMLKNGHYYGSIARGPAHIVFLDTGEDKKDGHREYFGMTDFDAYLAEQTRWLEHEVAGEAWKAARFRIVVQHIPAMPGRDLPRLRRLFAPLREAGVTVMLAAHWHNQQWLDADEFRPFPMVVGGAFKVSPSAEKTSGLATLTRCDIEGDALRIRQIFAGSGKVAVDRVLKS